MKNQEMVTIHKVVYNECIEVAIENEKLKKVNEDQEIVIRGINALLKINNEQTTVQDNLIESLKLTKKKQATEIEKQKNYIMALESEQSDYQKTTMRLNKENEGQAAEIEKLKKENERLKDQGQMDRGIDPLTDADFGRITGTHR